MSVQIEVITDTEAIDVSDPSGYSQEDIEDFVNGLLEAGDKLSWTYDDANDTLIVDTTTLDAEEVEDAIASLIVGGDSINVSYDNDANTLTISTPAIESMVEDTSPKLGGNLDVNEKSIGDGDNDIRVEFEESEDEDVIRFYVNGTEALNID